MIVIKPLLSLNIVMNIIEKSRKSLEFDKIAEKLSNYAKTKQSKEICLKTLPFDDIVKIKNELKCTAEAKYILDMPMIFRLNLSLIFNKFKRIWEQHIFQKKN